MCKGSDLLKVAAIGAAAYTGGASMGLWGAAEGAGAVAGAAGAGAAGAGAAELGGMSVIDAATGAVASSTAAAQAGLAPAYLTGAAAAGGAAGTLASAAGGSGTAAPAAGGSGLTLSNVAAGTSIANAGMGILSALGAKKPAAPTLLAPITMPTADDLATQRARAAMIAKLSQQRGRTSTILSNDSLGGN